MSSLWTSPAAREEGRRWGEAAAAALLLFWRSWGLAGAALACDWLFVALAYWLSSSLARSPRVRSGLAAAAMLYLGSIYLARQLPLVISVLGGSP